MTKRTWSKIGAVFGGLLMLGAVGGGVNLLRASGEFDEEFAELFRQFVVYAGVICAVQFAMGAALLWFGVRGLKRNPKPQDTANNTPEDIGAGRAESSA